MNLERRAKVNDIPTLSEVLPATIKRSIQATRFQSQPNVVPKPTLFVKLHVGKLAATPIPALASSYKLITTKWHSSRKPPGINANCRPEPRLPPRKYQSSRLPVSRKTRNGIPASRKDSAPDSSDFRFVDLRRSGTGIVNNVFNVHAGVKLSYLLTVGEAGCRELSIAARDLLYSSYRITADLLPTTCRGEITRQQNAKVTRRAFCRSSMETLRSCEILPIAGVELRQNTSPSSDPTKFGTALCRNVTFLDWHQRDRPLARQLSQFWNTRVGSWVFWTNSFYTSCISNGIF